ncbi:hypothetical protein D3C87_1537480 [compost metagenome]
MSGHVVEIDLTFAIVLAAAVLQTVHELRVLAFLELFDSTVLFVQQCVLPTICDRWTFLEDFVLGHDELVHRAFLAVVAGETFYFF